MVESVDLLLVLGRIFEVDQVACKSYQARKLLVYCVGCARGESERERAGRAGGGVGAEEGQSPSVQRSQLYVSVNVKVPVLSIERCELCPVFVCFFSH